MPDVLLNEVLTDLRALYPGDFSSIRLLRDGGGRVYVARAGERDYLVKAIGAGFLETAKSSVAITRYLEENGFPVPGIVRTKAGALRGEMPGEEGFYVVSAFIEGSDVEENEETEEIGALCGRMHALMRRYPGTLVKREKFFFIDRYLGYLARKNYPEDKIAEYRALGDMWWERVRELPKGFCHGDFHRGNLIRASDGTYYALDFDTSCEAFPLYDAMTICDCTDYFRFEREGFEKSRRAFARFLTGYERYSSFTREEKAALFDLIGVRHFQLQATILEIHGLDCVDEAFVDRQLDWLRKWREQTDAAREE